MINKTHTFWRKTDDPRSVVEAQELARDLQAPQLSLHARHRSV
ncbi:MAG: hypothetical protein Q8R07_00330 [Candidatus Uhrbacteria bacterium]|nr:hypothetical protein [Candidatus Uhrbacteria bacterium]